MRTRWNGQTRQFALIDEPLATGRLSWWVSAVHALRSAVWQPGAAAQFRTGAGRYLDTVSGMPLLREVGARVSVPLTLRQYFSSMNA